MSIKDNTLKSGWVAIVGRPNAGKSTLLNRVLKANLSIVSPKAQTTRENLLGILTEEQGQMVLVDTPGIHNAKPDGINAFMMKQVYEGLESPDLVWYMVDPATILKAEDEVLKRLKDLLGKNQAPIWLILNKADRFEKQILESKRDEIVTYAKNQYDITIAHSFLISAKAGGGCPGLIEQAWGVMPPAVEGRLYFDDPDQMSDKPVRYFISELIRKSLFEELDDEVPYSCGVLIDSFEEKKKPLRIEATLIVERDSQKGILIGAKGSKIKAIGISARKNIEAWLEQPVFLGLRVKVKKDWTKDQDGLKALGYGG